MNDVAFIGAGALGTALSLVIARSGHRVFLFTRDREKALFMKKNRHHPSLFKEQEFPENLIPTAEISCVENAHVVFLTVPSEEVRKVSQDIASYLPKTLVICSKGLERETGHFLGDVVKQESMKSDVCILSGPGFAKGIVSGHTTVQVLAGTCSISHVVDLFSGSPIVMQTTQDLIGTQIGGVVKNIIAIGCGLLERMEVRPNTHAFLMTQGFHEMLTLGCQLGAETSTLMGPSGLGDLILTCSHRTSRNFSFGFQLGKNGHTQSSQPLVEGVHNASALMKLIKKYSMKAPVCETICDVLEKRILPEQFLPRVLGILGE